MSSIDDFSRFFCSGGSCVDMINSYVCVCPHHYTGKRCGNLIPSPCANRRPGSAEDGPCLNGGKCLDVRHTSADQFHCGCPSGYAGRLCEQAIADAPAPSTCASSPCRTAPGTACYDLADGGFLCVCPPGRRCDTAQSGPTCLSAPCRYVPGTRCVDLPGGNFKCERVAIATTTAATVALARL